MNSEEIDDLLLRDNFVNIRYRGVYPIDQLPSNRSGIYIVNTSPSYISTGHWVAIVDDLFFCSYGVNPMNYGITGCHAFNNNQLQSINSSVCGLYVVAFVKCFARGYTLESFLSCYDVDTNVNDMIVSHAFM